MFGIRGHNTICIQIFIFIYIYIERERERDTYIHTSTYTSRHRHHRLGGKSQERGTIGGKNRAHRVAARSGGH